MITSFIITFRETLEAALIIGIILSYLVKTKQTKFNNIVYIGIVTAIFFSVIGAMIFENLASGFTGRTEQIFEGVTMLVGSILLTTMILWMLRQKNVASELKHKVEEEVLHSRKFGLFLLIFISVLREGIETVIFLGAASFISTENNLFGAVMGIALAVFLGFLIFVGSMKINIKNFFNVTSILLILFAAGLIAHGIHEFQEAKIIPTTIEHVWNINPAVNPDGSYPLFHEKGIIGGLLRGLFGYNGDPSMLEVIGYITYIGFVLVLWRKIDNKKFKKINN